MPDIHTLFSRHRLEWIARSFGHYSEELVREFYAYYVATVRSQIDRRDALAKQDPLENVTVRGIQVDISLHSIHRYLYGKDVDTTRNPLTIEFD